MATYRRLAAVPGVLWVQTGLRAHRRRVPMHPAAWATFLSGHPWTCGSTLLKPHVPGESILSPSFSVSDISIFRYFDISVIVGLLAADRPSCLALAIIGVGHECRRRRLDLEQSDGPSAGDCGDLLAERVNTGPYFDIEARIPGDIRTGEAWREFVDRSTQCGLFPAVEKITTYAKTSVSSLGVADRGDPA
ncbi:hypothetical protein V502_04950 [Pseudogymnoascus sp. VKM F-4520 (FW-2644)]|nr:hypothetical protein V502_04950 [Pseudogymnoascus sp. VKM F-4520 (FW-2644)]